MWVSSVIATYRWSRWFFYGESSVEMKVFHKRMP